MCQIILAGLAACFANLLIQISYCVYIIGFIVIWLWFSHEIANDLISSHCLSSVCLPWTVPFMSLRYQSLSVVETFNTFLQTTTVLWLREWPLSCNACTGQGSGSRWLGGWAPHPHPPWSGALLYVYCLFVFSLKTTKQLFTDCQINLNLWKTHGQIDWRKLTLCSWRCSAAIRTLHYSWTHVLF